MTAHSYSFKIAIKLVYQIARLVDIETHFRLEDDMKDKGLAACILLLAACMLDCGIVFAQDAATSTSPPSQTPTSTEERESSGSVDGTVVSASRETVVVRT